MENERFKAIVIKAMTNIQKRGIENIPYDEIMQELEKHTLKEFLTDEARKASKNNCSGQNE